MRILGVLLLLAVIVACGAPTGGAPAASGASDCAWTKPVSSGEPVPSGALPPLTAYTTGGEFSYRNASLGVLLPRDGTLRVDTSHSDGGAKFGWFRFRTGALTVTALRLDGPAQFRADVADGYGVSGLQITGLRFGAPGCWEVRGALATGDALDFIVRVVDPARTSITPTPSPITGPCPVTTAPPVALTPPADMNFTADVRSFAYGNEALWVVLPRDGALHPDPATGRPEDGVKFGWWRTVPGDLVIATRRIDAPAAPLPASIPCCYPGAFQVSGLRFAGYGCWEITGTVSGRSLTFVMRVAP